MTPEEIAVDFVTRFEKQIKETLGVTVLDITRTAVSVTRFVKDNPIIEDYYDGFNPRVITAIIASLYEEFVPEKVREERRRIDYITRVLKQKKSGKGQRQPGKDQDHQFLRSERQLQIGGSAGLRLCEGV